MLYTLMHKNHPVADLDIDEATSAIAAVQRVMNANHFPVGTCDGQHQVNRSRLNGWWQSRAIPASRSGIQSFLEKLNLNDSRMLLTKSFGLSLSDHYWIKPLASDVSWDDVNFFNHPFSEDIGNLLFGEALLPSGVSFHSPDNTSDGVLKKRWKIINGKRCLIKGGSNPFHQQPLNEVIASQIADALQIPHVTYRLMWENGQPYSVCGNFVTTHTEFVSAWHFLANWPREKHSVYAHLLSCCKAAGISPFLYLDQMIVFDYLIANEDRHLGNFGFLRDPDSLEWLGPVPLFDSGSSLGYNKLERQILSGQNLECKPFSTDHLSQLQYVSSFDWLDMDTVRSIPSLISNAFWEYGADEYMSHSRVAAIVSSAQKRIAALEEYVHQHQKKPLVSKLSEAQKQASERNRATESCPGPRTVHEASR